MLAPAALPAAGLFYWVGALGALYAVVLGAFRLLSGLRVWVLGGGRAVGPQLGAWAGGCAPRGGGGPRSVRLRVGEAVSGRRGRERGFEGQRRDSVRLWARSGPPRCPLALRSLVSEALLSGGSRSAVGPRSPTDGFLPLLRPGAPAAQLRAGVLRGAGAAVTRGAAPVRGAGRGPAHNSLVSVRPLLSDHEELRSSVPRHSGSDRGRSETLGQREGWREVCAGGVRNCERCLSDGVLRKALI